jgi:AraC-like DNA-binding protein
LAKEIGWSRKHLAQKFRKDIGLRPKTVARVIRFGKALKHAQNCCDIDWAGLAVDCGYADQAHLIRDFSEFSGQSPEAWRARLLNGTANTW